MADQKRFKITLFVTVEMEFEATGSDCQEAQKKARKRVMNAPNPLRLRVPKWVRDVEGTFKFEEIPNG